VDKTDHEIAFLEMNAHFRPGTPRGHAIKVCSEYSLAAVNDQQEAPFFVVNLFNAVMLDGSHWTVAFRTLLDSWLVWSDGQRFACLIKQNTTKLKQ